MFPLPQSAVSAVRDSALVGIRIDGLGRLSPGKVTVSAIRSDSDGSIAPGMFGRAELTLEEHEASMLEPFGDKYCQIMVYVDLLKLEVHQASCNRPDQPAAAQNHQRLARHGGQRG